MPNKKNELDVQQGLKITIEHSQMLNSDNAIRRAYEPDHRLKKIGRIILGFRTENRTALIFNPNDPDLNFIGWRDRCDYAEFLL